MKKDSPMNLAGEPGPGAGYRKVALEIAAQHPDAGPIRLKIASDSMRPFLRPGDVVVMSRLKAGEIPQRGDIIVVQPDDPVGGALPLTHRLIGRSAAGWLTKGDFRWFPDAPVAPQVVIGQAVAILRGDHWIDISTPAWRLANRFMGWMHFILGSLMASARQLRRFREDP